MNIRSCILAAALALSVVGCSSSGDGLSTEQKQAGDRMAQIVKKSKDWDSLSQDDKQFIISTQGGGSEAKARQMFEFMTHRGTPPSPGGGTGSPAGK